MKPPCDPDSIGVNLSEMSRSEVFWFYYEIDFWNNYNMYMYENIDSLMSLIGG